MKLKKLLKDCALGMWDGAMRQQYKNHMHSDESINGQSMIRVGRKTNGKGY